MLPITDFLSCTNPLDEFDSLSYHQVDPAEAGDLLDRLDALEARVAALEQTPSTGEATTGDSERQSVGIVDAFVAALADRPPRTEHGTAATVRVFALLLDSDCCDYSAPLNH
jgi:hypothetical protein